MTSAAPAFDPTKIDLNFEGLQLAWDLRLPIVVCSAGTGGGKTSFGPWWLYREIIEHQFEPRETQKYLVVAPTYKRFLEQGGATLSAFLVFFGPFGRYHIATRVFELHNGAQVFFGTADKPTSLEGIHFRAAWADELGQYTELAFETMLRRLAFFGGRFLGTTTPYNAGWFKRRIWDRAVAGDPSLRVVNWPSISNPGFPPAEYERMRRELPEWRFRMFYEGIPTRPAGLVYQEFDATRQVVPMAWDLERRELTVEGLGIRRIVRSSAGVDWGFSNLGAVVVVLTDGDNRRFVVEESASAEVPVTSEDRDADTWVVRARALRDRYRVERFVCDPSEPGFIEDFGKARLVAEAADNRIQPGIDAVSSAMKLRGDGTYGLYVAQGMAPELLNEIDTVQWKMAPDGSRRDEPQKGGDHCLDACRYVVHGTRAPRAGRLQDVEVIRAPVGPWRQW